MNSGSYLVFSFFILCNYRLHLSNFRTFSFIGTLFLLRRQVFKGDQQYRKAMIPHHSNYQKK